MINKILLPLDHTDPRSWEKGLPVALDHHLLCVVLPKEMMEQPGVRETILQVWQTDPIHYEIYQGAPPREYTATIRDALRRRFQEGGRL